MMLNVYKYIVLAGFSEEMLVLGKKLDCGFCDHYVYFALDGIEGDGIMGWIGCEDGDRISGTEGVDCFLVGFWVTFFIAWKGFKAGVEAVVFDRGSCKLVARWL